MSKVDLESFGLPGVYYIFAGKTRSLLTASGDKYRLNDFPWNLSAEDREELASFLEVTVGELEDAMVALHDTMKGLSPKSQRGSDKAVEASWDAVIEMNAKGDATGIKYSMVGKLLAPEYIRVDDILMKSESNIAVAISKDALSRDILNRLEAVNAADLWTTKSFSLVRDHLMAKVEPKTVGQTTGYLPVRNGVLDLRTLELIQTDDVYLSSAEVEYDPKATCPSVEKLLDNAFLPEQKELVLSVLGAALSGRRAPFILCLSGRGRNGKSILREMVTKLAASMITTEKLESLHDNFANQVFLGKRIIWQTEVSSKRDFTDKLKDVTGGTSLTVRYKYQNGQIQQEMQSVVIIDTNLPPHLEDSQAINDRLRFIDMPRTFVYELSGAPNEVLIDPVLADAWRDEMQGLLNLILPYAQYYLLNGHLKQDYKVGMEAYNQKSECMAKFLEEWCDIGEGCEVSLSTFIKYYKEYAKRNNISAASDGQIRHQLVKEFYFPVRHMKVMGLEIRRQAKIDLMSN